jgi:hypothetical protein
MSDPVPSGSLYRITPYRAGLYGIACELCHRTDEITVTDEESEAGPTRRKIVASKAKAKGWLKRKARGWRCPVCYRKQRADDLKRRKLGR